jgi:hypothetical protein
MRFPLPTGFDDARDFALERLLTEMNAAQPEAPDVTLRTSADFAGIRINKLAAVADADLVFTPPFAGNY